MPTQLVLPQLERAATTATIERYYKQPGEPIVAGEPLVVVATERFVWDVPATATGSISAILADPGSSVTIGSPLVELDTADHPADNARSNGRVRRVTPLARKIATLHQLDLAAVRGSGRGGVITRNDVRALLDDSASASTRTAAFNSCFTLDIPTEATITAPAPTDHVAANNAAQRAVAERAPIRSADRTQPRTAELVLPHALTAIEADLGRVQQYIAAHSPRLARRGVHLTPLVCVAYAVIGALREHRLVNGVWSEDGIIVRARVQLGVATGTAAPLIVANADDRSVQGVARALATSTVEGQPTFVIHESSTRWSEPQVGTGRAGALSMGAIEQRPVVVERQGVDQIEQRSQSILTLAYDARVLDQVHADAFLRAVQHRLEHFDPLC